MGFLRGQPMAGRPCAGLPLHEFWQAAYGVGEDGPYLFLVLGRPFPLCGHDDDHALDLAWPVPTVARSSHPKPSAVMAEASLSRALISAARRRFVGDDDV